MITIQTNRYILRRYCLPDPVALFADASHDDFLGLWFIGNSTREGDLVNSNESMSPSGGSNSNRSNIRTSINININRDDTAVNSDDGGAATRGGAGNPARRRAGLVGKVSSVDPTVCEERPHWHRHLDVGLAATL